MLHTVRPPVRQVKTQRIDSKGVFYWGGAASTSFFCDPTESIFVVFATALLCVYSPPGHVHVPCAVRVTVPACWFAHVLALR